MLRHPAAALAGSSITCSNAVAAVPAAAAAMPNLMCFVLLLVLLLKVVPYDSDEDEKVLPGPSVPFPDSPKDCAPSSSAPAVDQLQRSGECPYH